MTTYDPVSGRGGNHIVNFPMMTHQVGGVQPEWWEVEDANVTLSYIEDLSTESPAVTPTAYPQAFRVEPGVSGANKVVGQRIVIADHDYLYVGNTVSASVWVYQDTTADTITFELYADDVASPTIDTPALGSDGGSGGSGSLGTDSTTVTGQWVELKIEAVTLDSSDTHVEFRLSSGSNSDKFYFTAPNFVLGRYALPFEPNPLVSVHHRESSLWSKIPPTSTAVQTEDLSSYVHPLTLGIWGRDVHLAAAAGNSPYYIFPPYDPSKEADGENAVANTLISFGQAQGQSFFCHLNDNLQIQWKVNSTGSFQSVGASMHGYVHFAY